ncbi:MAG TPA: sigma-54 dependent transcriptional regulator [Terriglobia bacterium]|nr:sigma-54 dependent transcriptional regulator [Terriglobia bacterium]
MNPSRVWVVNSDANLVSQFATALSSEGYLAENVTGKTIELRSDQCPAAIVLSVIESGTPGLNLLISARKAVPPIPVVVFVAPSQIRIAVEALKLGASDALVTPVDPSDLVAAVKAAQQKDQGGSSLPQSPEYTCGTDPDVAVFISRSEKMREIWNLATKVARADVPVLILGESGVGKEVLARFIHRHSKRADKSMVKVNCAALPHDLLESELFGYERGAFTGAVGEKPGKFELADKGCMLLDEIGEMSPSLQAKLLHVLEDGEFSKLGGRRSVKVDVRVLALTNRRLDEAVPRGEFRNDLYFRLNVVKITIPPLRERKEDIPLLCDYFLKRHREALGSSMKEFPPDLIDVFVRHNWPGNVRQLENTVRRYLILPKLDMEIGAAPPPEPEPPKVAFAAAAAAGAAELIPFPSPEDSVSLKTISAMAADRAEREVVLRVLEQSNWNRVHAARRLNICYKALLNKLKKWQIQRRRAS